MLKTGTVRMRKLAMIAGGVVVAGAAAWSGLWFLGRGEVTDQIGAYLDRLRATGYEITHGTPSVTGFPFGYGVTYPDIVFTDPTGLRTTIPTMTGAADVSAPDTVRLDFPPTMTIAMPTSEEERALNPSLPDEITFDVEADSLVTLIRDTGDGIEAATSATSLLIVSPSFYGASTSFALEVVAYEGKAKLPAIGGPATWSDVSTVDEINLQIGIRDEAQPDISFDVTAQYDALQIISSGSGDAAAILAQLGTGPAVAAEGTFNLTYTVGKSAARIVAGASDDPEGGAFDYTAGALAGTMKVADGRLTASTENRTPTWSFAPNADEIAYRGTVSAEIAEFHYDAPATSGPDDAMEPMSIRIALDDLTGDDVFWRALDPFEALQRDPARLFLDIGGSGRVMKPFGDMLPGEAPPFEFGNLEIRTAEMAALGSSIETTGAIEFLQPGSVPTGTLTVTLGGMDSLLPSLAAAGLIDAPMRQMGEAMLQVYARPGDVPGTHQSEITFDPARGVLINGLPLQ